MSRFWQLFWPVLARKAGQRDSQTLVGGLGARHGTSAATELLNAIELQATASEIAAAKPTPLRVFFLCFATQSLQIAL